MDDSLTLVDTRWQRYLQIKACPECEHDAYTMRVTGHFSSGALTGKYWRYTCKSHGCGCTWWNPQRGPDSGKRTYTKTQPNWD